MKKIKVGLIQQSNTADIRVNLMNLAKSIEACAAHGAQLIVLQELHNSLYFCQTENTNLFDLAEPIPGPSTGFYSELAAANKVVLVASLFEKRAPGLYHNTAVVFDRDGSIAGKYRKMHIPDDPAYYEKFYFTPGDIGFEPIQTSLGKLGVLVCWDQWYPEAARLMALKGAELLIYPTAIGWESSDTDDEKARQLEKELGCKAYKADVTSAKEVSAAVESIATDFGKIDVLINNTGISQIKMLSDVTELDWYNMIDVHLTGAFNITKAVLPFMINRKQGSIINISSVWGVYGASCEVPYSTVKAGLIGFTKSLSKEVAPSGITVNCIAPGVIDSPMNNAHLSPDEMNELIAETPLGRLGTPDDVAKAAVYLAFAGFVTGQILGVDGGFY